jgi:hypothetical protein
MEVLDESRRISRVIGGALLVLVGSLFLFQNLGLVNAGRLVDYWPLLLVWIGLSRMLAPARPRHFPSGAVFFALGVFLQLERLDWIHIGARDVWPAFLIVAGVALVADSVLARRTAPELGPPREVGPGDRP